MLEQKKVAILGSTGSIGMSALEVVGHLKDRIAVEALAAHSNIDLLLKQIIEFKPKHVAVYDEKQAALLKERLPQQKILSGMQGLEEIASDASVDTVVAAISGAVGITPTLAAIRAGKVVALANKEVLVAAGEIVMESVSRYGATLLPVDSEHSALFQCLLGESITAVHRLILTASGGPFFFLSKKEREHVTKERALKHPTWSMGAKITVDSSTLMNKGLEVIEAAYLFNIPADKIDVIVHPQSVIHSMVEYQDGSTLCQMSAPTMLVPIQYALTYPERLPGLLRPFDFTKYARLDFHPLEKGDFVCLDLAYHALKVGGGMPCFLNAANEVLNARFLSGKIRWIEIGTKLEKLLTSYTPGPARTIEAIMDIDARARALAQDI